MEFKGSKPKGGALLINNKGEIALAIHNGEYCIKKWYTDEDINVSKGIENCTLDFVPPTITLSNEGPIFVLLNEEFIIPEATAYDDVSLDVTTSIQIDSNVDNTKIGHYEITYTVSDAAGNKASKTIKVFVGNKYEYTTPSSTAYTLVVPYTGTYRIEVSGAQGGRGGDRFGSGGSQYFKAADGEKGSKQEGIFYLNEGDTISILVGGIGRDGEVKNNTSQYYRTQNGGNGGGSSVKINNVVAIQAAGGEGSLGHNPCGTTCNNSSDVKASNGINGTITTNVNTGDNPIYTAKSQLGNGLVKITIID